MRIALRALLALLATALLLELGTCGLVKAGRLDSPPPRDPSQSYWRGDHPEFGVWHEPGLVYAHTTECYDVQYRANSFGARDVERELESERPRVVVLGDSFFEGWGVAEPERLSNRLEAQTGIEHLNLAMAHFGTYQEYLVYRELGTRFDHDAVLLGFLPANDFGDNDLEDARAAAYYRFRWRPYLTPDGEGFRHVQLREPFWRRWLRHRSYAGTAWLTASEGRARQEAVDRVAEEGKRARFYDFRESQIELLEEILRRLARAANGRTVAVILIPTLSDFDAFERLGPDSLSPRLRAAGRRDGYQVVNLLPAMAKHTRRWGAYFLPCDYHWSPRGNEIAARYVRRALTPSVYPARAAVSP